MADGEPRASRRRVLLAGLGLGAAACSSRHRSTAGAAPPGQGAPSSSEPPASPSSSAGPQPDTTSPSGPARFVQHGPADAKAAALTFHVAGDPAAARRLFDQAARLQVPLTLFLVGTFVKANAGYVAELTKAGHELANHTATHPTLGRLGPAATADEVLGCRSALLDATGEPGRWFRPSGMEVATPLVLEQAGKAGYDTVVGYDVDPHDYQDPGTGAVVERVRAGLHPGAIVSMHTAHDGTIAALPDVVAAARTAGLRLVTVSALLGLA